MPQSHVAPEKQTLFNRIRTSIFPGTLWPGKDQKDYRQFFNTLFLHFRPRTVDERTLQLTLTWGLGGMAAVLIMLLFGTGVLLKFVYEPFPDKAYESILYLQQDVHFGGLIRNIHHWSANGLLIVAFLHFLRVFFTGAFHPPRQFNWIIGLGLFTTILLSNFTGYLMPWDQLAFWAVTISTGTLEYIPGAGEWLQRLILGGTEVGTATLSNFYAIHTVILPAFLIFLMPFHFWRIRKAGGLVIPRTPNENAEIRSGRVDVIPSLIVRELVVALVLLAFILVFSILFNAPLEGKANPGLSPNPTKAPWYFMGIQELLMHFHPFFSLLVIPALLLLALLVVPYIDYPADTSGVWFASLNGRRTALMAALTAILATTAGVLIDEYVIDLAAWMHGVPEVITNGLLPFAFILAGVAGFYKWIKLRFSATTNESVQAVFVLFLVAFLVLTLTGIGFRGEGMRLMWPWG
ncbi:cytochrome b N-terminal domain-containing protein [Thermodesulfobacteriota bacterium]